MKIKLRGIRKQFRKQNRHSPIEFVTGRVKSVESIKEKWNFGGLNLKILHRICKILQVFVLWFQFVDDVDEVLALLRGRHDMTIVSRTRLYQYMKASGYRSYHVIVEYPVDTIDGQKRSWLRFKFEH